MKSKTTCAVRRLSTAIGIKLTTRAKLDRNRAPGQCYDGFIRQLVDLWEKVKEGRRDYVVNSNKREVMPIETRKKQTSTK